MFEALTLSVVKSPINSSTELEVVAIAMIHNPTCHTPEECNIVGSGKIVKKKKNLTH